MNLFDLWATIKLDPSEYERGVKHAMSYGYELEDSLRDVSKRADMAGDDVTALGSDLDKTGSDASSFRSDVGKAEQAVRDLGDEADDTRTEVDGLGSSFDSAAGLLKKGFGVMAGAKIFDTIKDSIIGTAASTEEYRVAQVKLNTAFENANFTGEAAKQTFTEFYKILGDTDQATEAAQLTANWVETEEDLVKVTKLSAGIMGVFGDSLPIEGLVESANETARVGEVTGVLADALNWVSISEDEFNKLLAECSSEQERNQLILETLSDTYAEASDIFYENNEQISKNRDNQIKLQESMSNLGGAVAGLGDKLLDRFIPHIETATGAMADFIKSIDADAIANTADNIIGTVSTAFNMVSDVTTNAMDIMKESIESGQGEMNWLTALTQAWLSYDGMTVSLYVDTAQAIENVNALNRAEDAVLSRSGSMLTLYADTAEAAGSLGNVQKQIEEIMQKNNSDVKIRVTAVIDAEGDTEVLYLTNKHGTITSTVTKFAGGIDYVPYDNYPSLLHEGETVLTKQEADAYRRGNSGGSPIIINQYIQSVPQTAIEFAAATEAMFEQARWAF